MQKFYQTGDIYDVSRANKVGSVFIDSIGKLTIFAQMELLGKLQNVLFLSQLSLQKKRFCDSVG